MLREGGGLIDLVRADNPLLFASPTSISFPVNGGTVHVEPHRRRRRRRRLVGLDRRSSSTHAGVDGRPRPTASPSRASSTVTANVVARGRERRRHRLRRPHARRPTPAGSRSGSRSTIRCSARSPRRALTHPGIYSATTVGGAEQGLPLPLPDRRRHAPTPAPRSSTACTSRSRSRTSASPSSPAAPSRTSSSRATRTTSSASRGSRPTSTRTSRRFGEARPVAGAILPAPGHLRHRLRHALASRGPGPFTFRYWVNDTTPPTLRARCSSDRPERSSSRSPTPAPASTRSSIRATVDGRTRPACTTPRPADRRPPAAAGTIADRHGLRLPGAEEHGGRRADQAEHGDPHGRTVDGRLATSGAWRRARRSSAARRGRARPRARTPRSPGRRRRCSFDFRRARSRSRRAVDAEPAGDPPTIRRLRRARPPRPAARSQTGSCPEGYCRTSADRRWQTRRG